MDYYNIKANYYIDSVSIEADDFEYIAICKTHDGIQIDESLKDKEEIIIKKCREIKKLMFELREIVGK